MILNILKRLILNCYWTRPFFQKLAKTCKKNFKKFSKDHKELEKTLQDKLDVSLEESTQICDACETFKKKKGSRYV